MDNLTLTRTLAQLAKDSIPPRKKVGKVLIVTTAFRALNWHFDSEDEERCRILERNLTMRAAMAVTAMPELPGIASLPLLTRHGEDRGNRSSVVRVSTSALASSNSSCCAASKRDVDAERHGLLARWRTRAVARTAAVEGVAEAKRVIDEVLRSNGGDGKGAGGLAEVSWVLYTDEATKKVLADAVTKLCACRGQDFGDFLRSRDAHGVWEVFYAPHIFAMSNAVGTQIRPLQYILTDSGFSSHARYFSPVGEGWLSAAGDYVVRDGTTVEILFDSFWADAGRDNLQPDPKGEGAIPRTLVNLVGRGAFFKALSVYPVYYADADITVFEFTTLSTRVAARKIRTA